MELSGELEGLTTLTQGETEQLLFTIQSSLAIRRRYQFHIWVQSRLAAMVPHDALICAHHGVSGNALVYDCFAMFPLPRDALAALYAADTGLMARLVEFWNRTERMPCSSEQAAADTPRRAGLQAALLDSCIGEFVAHGTPAQQDPQVPETFFCFAQVGPALVPPHVKRDLKPITARHSFMLELLTPYLHATYRRIIAAEQGRDAPRQEAAPTQLVITGREVEILGWVREGKSNQEIGTLLNISPLTVKNHVQKILRKLGASNRAQAVSKALGLHLLPSGTQAAERLEA